MRIFLNLLVLAALFCISYPVNADSPKRSLDLSELAQIKAICTSDRSLRAFPAQNDEPGIEHELALIQNRLAKTPNARKERVLIRLTERTKWGTPARALSSFVCAWYGIDYTTNRDYLVHAAFWNNNSWHKPTDKAPFCWNPEAADILYALYEHNQDISLLHDILTAKDIEEAGEVLDIVKGEICGKHPNGVLQVAAKSPEGRKVVVDLLSPALQDPMGEIEAAQPDLRAYIQKVADDPKNPLQPTAQTILREALPSKP